MRQRKLLIIFKCKLNKGIRSVKQGIAARGVRPVQYAVAAVLIHYYVVRHECAMACGLTAGQGIKRCAKGYALLLILYAFAYGVFQLIGKAGEKAKAEYRKYQAQNLSPVEEEYLQTIRSIEKAAKEGEKR